MSSESKRGPNRIRVRDMNKEQKRAYDKKMRERRKAKDPEKYAALKHYYYNKYRKNIGDDEYKRRKNECTRKRHANPEKYRRHLKCNREGYHRRKREKAEKAEKAAEEAKRREGAEYWRNVSLLAEDNEIVQQQ